VDATGWGTIISIIRDSDSRHGILVVVQEVYRPEVRIVFITAVMDSE